MSVCLCWSLVQETLLGDGQDFVFKWIVNVLHTQASNSFPSIPPSALHNVNLLRDLTDFLTFRREKKKAWERKQGCSSSRSGNTVFNHGNGADASTATAAGPVSAASSSFIPL